MQRLKSMVAGDDFKNVNDSAENLDVVKLGEQITKVKEIPFSTTKASLHNPSNLIKVNSESESKTNFFKKRGKSVQADVRSRYMNFESRIDRSVVDDYDTTMETSKLPMPVLDQKLTLDKNALQSHFRLCKSAKKRPEGVREVHKSIAKVCQTATISPEKDGIERNSYYKSPKYVMNQVISYEND